MQENTYPDNAEQQAIIDRFLAVAPTLQRIKPIAEEDYPFDEEAAETETNTTPIDSVTAEALAKALVAQGKRKEAAAILLKLAAENPLKSAYFADLLDNRTEGLDIF